MDILLPCPFCGENPVVEPENPKEEGDAWTNIRCSNMKCAARPNVRHHADRGHYEVAVNRWNRRAD